MKKSTEVPEQSYLSTKELDSLVRMNTELLSELWTLKDRVILLEHLLTEADILSPDQIDHLQPSTELEDKLRAERDQLVARVIGAGHRRELSISEIKGLNRKQRSDD